MENNLEQQFSEDLLIAKSSNLVREDSDPIPVDLLIDILSRVPAYSIARFRCVSKSWESILRRPDFTELFLTKSVSLPRLLFVVPVNEDSDDEDPFNEASFVSSSPQPQNPDDKSSLVATPFKKCFFRKYIPWDLSPQVVGGLVFLQHSWRTKPQVIFNPVTGESIFLPSMKASGIKRSYFGFDPISKQFKVLCITWSRYETPDTHRILTLETGIKRRWRTIQGPVLPHDYINDGICIKGVLYYEATFPDGCSKMVCFDFRFEKFSFVKLHKDIVPTQRLKLFNCKGKLGAHQRCGFSEERFALWVLEDAGQHKWSKRICILPSKLNKACFFLGMTGTGEIVFSPLTGYHPFCISYYNIERNTVTRINIQGFEKFQNQSSFVSTFLDYEENLKASLRL
ncbi:PREDICTED: putative F-box protein At1g53370 [Camelina sativa]|uniref:F-box protein At1g53370 n=1 Tax=Camelina sativa TaxID=90675 RepID=A0ABM0YHQ9_CAMSA|nr:PREDICTED: putative F-box protein At1g53370 [Camelina sativa]